MTETVTPVSSRRHRAVNLNLHVLLRPIPGERLSWGSGVKAEKAPETGTPEACCFPMSTLRKLYATPWNPWTPTESLDEKNGRHFKSP